MALSAASDYVREAQVLLNDVGGVRYTTEIVLNALVDGLYDMQRLRPDLFINKSAPDPLSVNSPLADVVHPMYRTALLEYAVGYCERIDQETSDTSRATTYYASFVAKLTGRAA